MDQVPLPHMIVLDDTWYTKGSHGPVCFPQPGAVSEKSCYSIKLCFHQCGIQPNTLEIFQVTGRVIEDFYKNAAKMMCSCSEK